MSYSKYEYKKESVYKTKFAILKLRNYNFNIYFIIYI